MVFLRSFFLSLCLFLSSGLGRERDLIDPLLHALNPEEKIIHSCLEQNRNSFESQLNCLKGTPYDQKSRRSPSSEVNGLIEKLEWFFTSSEKRFSFFRVIDALNRAKDTIRQSGDLIDGHGIGVVGEAYFGVGESWVAEVVRHEGKLGLFCAPGISGRTDFGVSLGVTTLRTLSCQSNTHYEGNFLTIGAGVSGELIGLPVGLGLNYSFGVDLVKLKRDLNLARQREKYHPKDLKEELRRLSSIREYFRSQNKEDEEATILIEYGAMLTSIIEPTIKFTKPQSGIKLRALRRAISKRESLGGRFKNFIHSKKFQEFFTQNDMPNLREFFQVLSLSFSGCDSLGGAGSLSFSVSPVTVGVTYTNYHLLFETRENEMGKVKRISPLALLNPFLLNANELQFIRKNARSILAIPKKIKENCRMRQVLR